MNSLSILQKIASSKPISVILSAFGKGEFPLEIEQAEGSLPSLLLAILARASMQTASQAKSDGKTGTGGNGTTGAPLPPVPVLAVVPTELDATELASDLAALGAVDADAMSSAILPGWETVPYRPLMSAAAVFGERARTLSRLAPGGQRPIVVIASERAFLTPVPPPQYLADMLVTIRIGDALDTTDIAGKLAAYGYTRTPKVQMHGEFALRGEVLDVFMPGDEAAYSVLFDFDIVESIKKFNPLDQSGTEKTAELTILPLKEVIWTDERIETLSNNLAQFNEFKDNGKKIIEDLIARRTTEGEEMLFPLAFERPATVLDYLGGRGDASKSPAKAGINYDGVARRRPDDGRGMSERQQAAEGERELRSGSCGAGGGEREVEGAVFFFDKERLVNAQEAA